MYVVYVYSVYLYLYLETWQDPWIVGGGVTAAPLEVTSSDTYCITGNSQNIGSAHQHPGKLALARIQS